EHRMRTGQPAEPGVERVCDPAPVPLDDLVDVPLVAALRPPALVVPSRHVFRLVGNLDELAAFQAEHLGPLTADGGHEDAVAPPDEPGKRREVELAADLDGVANRLGERQRAPEVVEPRREDPDTPHAVAVEAVVEPARDALDVRLQRLPLGTGELALTLVELALRHGEERVHP